MSLMLVRKVIRRWPVRGPVGVCALSLLFLVGWVGVLRAEGPTRQPDSPLPASVPSAAAAVSVPSSASSSSSGSANPAESSGAETDFSFDLLPKAPPKTPEGVAQVQEIERKSRIRRGMLRTHLVLGIATMATMAATLVVGQLNYQDQFVNGDFSGRYETPHFVLGLGATTLFTANAALALFSPDPYKKKYRLDTVMVHRIAEGLAAAGMVTQIALGLVTSARVGRLDQPNLALAHLVTGYATYAFMATGTVAHFF
ncbi:MAG TPA: hypothetical protein PKE31_04435 [Pseudomonadota bacterium]|nr:hypothetical protein [Pseudomonadota bacterium]